MFSIPKIKKPNPKDLFTSNALERAKQVVPFFYYFLTIISVLRLEGFTHQGVDLPGAFSPKWPVFWMDYLNYETAVTAVFVGFVALSLIGAFFYRSRLARLASFLGILQYHAYVNSLGGPRHQLDLWLWVALILILLPSFGSSDNENKAKFLMVFLGAQAFVLLSYTMSGLGKVVGAVKQTVAGETSILHIDAAALYVISSIQQYAGDALWEGLIIGAPLIGWILLLFSTYLEFSSIFVLFRPKLHRPWGTGLILFHIGTLIFMGAIFSWHIPLLAVFLLASPFYEVGSVKDTILELPVIKCLAKG